MAIELRFNCNFDPEDFIIVHSNDESVYIDGIHQGYQFVFELDIPTAIKLSKTIRTHINKVKKI